MTSALMRGRTLDRGMVQLAQHWRRVRKGALKGKLRDGTITMKERRELWWRK